MQWNNVSNNAHSIKFHGHIHNRDKFKGSTDAEIMLHGLIQHGPEFLTKCHGDWVFVYTDGERTMLCRDILGTYPLYYHTVTKQYSTYLPDLIQTSDTVHRESVAEYLTYGYVTAPNTVISNICKVDASEYVMLETGKRTKYYTLRYKPSNKPFTQKKEELHELIISCVKPYNDVASLLSCGLDSCIITMLAYSPKMTTHNIVFDSSNEAEQAQQISDYIQTQHNTIHFHDKDLITHIPFCIKSLSEPISDPSIIVTHMFQDHCDQNIMTGQLADILFGGQDHHTLWVRGNVLKHLAIFQARSADYTRLRKMRGKQGFDAYHELICTFSSKEIELLGFTPCKVPKNWIIAPRLFQATYYDMFNQVPNSTMVKLHACNRYVTPYNNKKLLEYAFSLNQNDLLYKRQKKYVLQECFKHELPHHADKRTKKGFNLRVDKWFATLQYQLQDLLENQDLIQPNYVRKLLKQPLNSTYKQNMVTAQKMWSVYVLLSWLKHHKGL